MKQNPAITHESFSNGACLAWEPWPMSKYAIFDAYGVHHGWRRDLSAARELAASLPGQPVVVEPPRVIPRSPRAMPLPGSSGVPVGVPRDQQPWRAPPPRAVLAYANTKRHWGR